MVTITLEEAKRQCNLVGVDVHDQLLDDLIKTAGATIEIDLKADIDRLTLSGDYPNNPILKHAAKLLVAHWFRYREEGAEKAITKIPMGYSQLIARLRTPSHTRPFTRPQYKY